MEMQRDPGSNMMMCQFRDPENGPLGKPMNVSEAFGPKELHLILNNLLENEERLPYSFYISDKELLTDLSTYLQKQKVSVEKVVEIVYQPQAVYSPIYVMVTIHDRDREHEFADDAIPSLSKLRQDVDDSIEDIDHQTIGYVLPDNEDELFAGIMDYELSALPNQLEELEEADLFDSLGGMELDGDPQDSLCMGLSGISLSNGVIGNGLMSVGISNGAAAVAGEHPYREHPSHPLFVRKINSNVEDTELTSLFEVIMNEFTSDMITLKQKSHHAYIKCHFLQCCPFHEYRSELSENICKCFFLKE